MQPAAEVCGVAAKSARRTLRGDPRVMFGADGSAVRRPRPFQRIVYHLRAARIEVNVSNLPAQLLVTDDHARLRRVPLPSASPALCVAAENMAERASPRPNVARFRRQQVT